MPGPAVSEAQGTGSHSPSLPWGVLLVLGWWRTPGPSKTAAKTEITDRWAVVYGGPIVQAVGGRGR